MQSDRPSTLCALLVAAACLGTPGRALAQTQSTAAAARSSGSARALDARARDEARQRFDRGLALYNQGDAIGALAEFQVAYKLTGHPMVLYNLALVRARLGHAAEAVDALEKLRAMPSAELAPGTLERAQILYEAQLARVGTLEIKTSTPRALVQIDNVDVARTPAPPIRISAGIHLVSISAAGYEPRHLQVTVAGRASEVLELELTPLDAAPAQLMIGSSLPTVQVHADGVLVGRTPLSHGLVLSAGSHELEFSREGYSSVRRSVVLPAGGSAQLEIQMTSTAAGIRQGGVLALRISESGAVVFVDGQPRPDATRGMRLPLGLHSVRVQRAGFFDLIRDVTVEPGQSTIDARLLPTPNYLSDYVSRARGRRTWSYVALGAGGLLAAGGGAFLLWNQGEKNAARQRFDDYADTIEQLPGGRCPDDACEASLDIYTNDLDAKQRRDVYGWVGVGAGVLGAATGVLLYCLGDPPGRYDTQPESDVFGALGLGFAGGPTLRFNSRF